MFILSKKHTFEISNKLTDVFFYSSEENQVYTYYFNKHKLRTAFVLLFLCIEPGICTCVCEPNFDLPPSFNYHRTST